MTGRTSRRKGQTAERELAKLIARYGFSAQRTPYSGAGTIKGDLIGRDFAACIPGFHIECKRVERLDLPRAIRQSWADAGANIPTVFHRRNDNQTGDPLAKWHVTLPAEDWLADQAELRSLRCRAEIVDTLQSLGTRSLACLCGEINARHCPVHQETAA